MKHYLLSLLLVLGVLGICQTAGADEPENNERRHVIVTLQSGEKIEGYLTQGWQPENSMFKKVNFSFKIARTPDGKEAAKYTADEVVSIDYLEATENYPDGQRWESHPLANPSFKSRFHTTQQFFCVDKVGKNATTYWWRAWASTGRNLSRREVLTYVGVRFHNDPEGIVYTYPLVNSVLTRDKYPGLEDFYEEWFKGSEGKAHKKESEENDAWILDMYDAYLARMGDAAADLPKAITGKRGNTKKNKK